jgi:hypothetical protein
VGLVGGSVTLALDVNSRFMLETMWLGLEQDHILMNVGLDLDARREYVTLLFFSWSTDHYTLGGLTYFRSGQLSMGLYIGLEVCWAITQSY